MGVDEDLENSGNVGSGAVELDPDLDGMGDGAPPVPTL